MLFKSLILIGILSTNVAAEHEHGNLRSEAGSEAMDEDRELFPLLPGTRCPTGTNCRVANKVGLHDASPMASALKNSMKTPLAMTLDWNEFNNELKTVVASDNYCSRRGAMSRAAGMAAGLTAAAVAKPAFAAETKEVKMGSDSGLLAFIPAKVTICKGDTITWINNKAGPHNVVFDEDAIPAGVSQEKISMNDEQLGEEGETFTRTFDTAGDYAYYCDPHRGAGMNGAVTVI